MQRREVLAAEPDKPALRNTDSPASWFRCPPRRPRRSEGNNYEHPCSAFASLLLRHSERSKSTHRLNRT